MNNLLTTEEVRSFLEINQDELDQYVKRGKIQSYKIGGTYLRFRKEDVLNLRIEVMPKKALHSKAPISTKLADFWRFNNFYIISLIAIGVALYLVITTS